MTRELESDIEQIVAAAWRDVLGVSEIGVNDNFFDLGADSLTLILIANRICEVLKIDIPVHILFDTPTVAEMTAAVSAAAKNQRAAESLLLRPEEPASGAGDTKTVPTALERVRRDGPLPLPLSYAQERLWFLDQLEAGSASYSYGWVIPLVGEVDDGALVAAFDALVRRHESLRTTVDVVDGLPVQRIHEPSRGVVRVEDVSDLDEAAVWRRAQQEAAKPFDLKHGPLLRVTLFRRSARERTLLLEIHHIVSDGWSMEVLTRETGRLYEAFRRGERSPLGELEIQYADFASWQRQYLTDERLGREVAFWKGLLSGAPQALELPTDRPRPPVESHRGAVLSLELAHPLSERLQRIARERDATLFMVLLASYGLLLGRHANQADVVVGTPIANRTRTEFEPLIGFFVNTLALRVRFDDDPTFEELLARVKRVSLEAFEHQELPFEKLVEALNPVRDMSRSPVFQAMFTMQNAPLGELEMEGATMDLLPLERVTAMFDLTLFVTETKSGAHLDVEYNTDLFDRSTVERWIEHWRVLLEGICQHPMARCSELPIVPEVERHKLLVEWNDTRTAYTKDRCLHRLFEEQVDTTPDAVAVVFEREQLSYRELDARANQLAHHLRALGVGPEVLVGICVERSLEMVVGLLGILKAGGAYVPMDPDYPQERISFMLKDSATPVLLTQAHLKSRLSDQHTTIVGLDAEWTNIAKSPTARLGTAVTEKHLAYAIYTSGSTGRPKGAMNTHGGICNRLAWMQDAYGLTEADVVLQKTPFSFDVSVWEFFWPLIRGARLVMARPGGQRDSAYLTEIIDEQGVTTVHFVPSMLQAFLEGNDLRATCRSLRRVICSGEALSSELARRFFESGSEADLHNLYGPTEAAVDVTFWECKRASTRSSIPLGRPIANIQLYVVDSGLETVPIGVSGELCIAGVGLSRGYLHRPGLTAERFVPNPFADGGTRMYRTGDLARWLPDGNLEFLGRIDHQVKIHGFRIELGEIESQLQGHGGVRDAIVLAREDTPGNKRLVAYVTPKDPAAPPAIETLREHLKEKLPEYMVPTAWVVLEHLPLTPNGKLDRKALPAPDLTTQAEEYVAPRNRTEEQLSALFAEVLGVPRVGIHDNFFALGGHSLLILRLLGKLRRIGWETPIHEVFAAPTVAGMANRLRRAIVFEAPPNRIPDKAEMITPEMLSLVELSQESIDRIVTTLPDGIRNVEDIYPLTPWQEGTLFEHLAAREGSILNVQLFHCDSKESVERFLEGLERVVQRHAIWRTAILWEGLPRPVQVVYREAKLPVQRLDETSESDEELLRRGIDLQHGFDLTRAPMLRVIVARNAGGWRVVFAIHDLVEDITSIRLMMESIRAHMRGAVPASFSSLPFRTYVAYVLSRDTDSSEAFWRKQLNGITEPTLPLGYLPERETQSSEHVFWLEPSLVQGLLNVCLELSISSAAVLHAAFGLALGRCSGTSDVLFGTMMFGRSAPLEGVERAAGVFLHALPVRLEVSGKTLRASLLEVHALIAELIAHEHVPMTTIQKCSQIRLPTRLFECVVNYRQGARSLDDAGLPDPLPTLRATLERVRFLFWMNVDDFGDRIRLSTVAPRELGPRFVEYLNQALLLVTRAPDTALEAVDVLPGAERQKLLVEWNDTRREYPKDVCLHDLFEEQVARTPDGVALEEGSESASYRELNERANRLAHELMARGVGPEVVVGVSLERSIDLVVSVLAVLKAGGAYVPLDPGYPAERLLFVCKDAGVKLVLCAARGPLGAVAELFVLKEHTDAVAARPSRNPKRSQGPDSLFAVIYTSGSTGVPKGVLTTHRSFVNRMDWMWRTYPYRAGEKACHKTAPSFVDSISELFGPLLVGVPVVLASQEVGQDVAALVTLLGRTQASRIVLVPSLLHAMLSLYPDLAAKVPNLWHWTVSGEKLDPQLVSSFRAALADRVLLNLYGSSEVAADVTYDETSARSGGSEVRIGRPINNVFVVVVDADGLLVPTGVTGEVLVGGVALARGYLHRAGLTAEKFVPDAWSGSIGGRMYRTGDRARWLPDGTLEYQGRADHQVKVRGMRVELGEVQALLLEHASVGDGVVDTRPGADGSPLIVAYVTPKEASAPPTAESLRNHLRAKLPEYMVPSSFVVLERLPKTPGGKVDRKALPAPDMTAPADQYVAPREPVEEQLCGLFADVLGVPRVGIHDNFFELGGHSLLITRLVNRIRSTLGVELSVLTVFESPTVAQLVAGHGLSQLEEWAV